MIQRPIQIAHEPYEPYDSLVRDVEAVEPYNGSDVIFFTGNDLCGLAETSTMHSFARSFVRENYGRCQYYPKMYELIEEDLKLEGIEKFEIGDDNYKKKTIKYKAVGDADVVYYAVEILQERSKENSRI